MIRSAISGEAKSSMASSMKAVLTLSFMEGLPVIGPLVAFVKVKGAAN